MKFNEFRKKMVKPVFSWEEAKTVAWETKPYTLAQELHQWSQKGDLIGLKRGVYAYPEKMGSKAEIACVLYAPSYISLEYALHFYGLIPDVAFAVTMVTPKTTRTVHSPMGDFVYRHLKPSLFWGYDPETGMGEREKVILDYFYLSGRDLKSTVEFWETFRWQNLREIDFKKMKKLAPKFETKKVVQLADSLASYAKKHGSA